MPSRPGSIQCAIVAALAFAGCHRTAHIPDGDFTATLTATPVGTQGFMPTALHGKPSLVLFVTPTCPHCLATLPAAATAARAADGNVVAVFVAGTVDNASGVVNRTHFWGPALVDDGTLRTRYDIKAVPVTYVLGPDGHARDMLVGEQDEATLRRALADAR